MNIAQQIVANAKDAHDAYEKCIASKEIKEAEQNWEDESTTYVFTDNSKVVLSGPEFKAI